MGRYLPKYYSIIDTAQRLGVHPASLSSWIKIFESPEAKAKNNQELSYHTEIKCLRKELKRVTKERDILKKGRSILCKPSKLKYEFIKEYSKH